MKCEISTEKIRGHQKYVRRNEEKMTDTRPQSNRRRSRERQIHDRKVTEDVEENVRYTTAK